MNDGQWYVGTVTEKSEEHGDVIINFMSRNIRTNVLTWPSRKDECPVLTQNILCTLPVPDTTGSSGRQYRLPVDIIETINRKFSFYLDSNKAQDK